MYETSITYIIPYNTMKVINYFLWVPQKHMYLNKYQLEMKIKVVRVIIHQFAGARRVRSKLFFLTQTLCNF